MSDTNGTNGNNGNEGKMNTSFSSSKLLDDMSSTSRKRAAEEGRSSGNTFNNCVFHDNENDGIEGDHNATIHLHGEATAIYSNRTGIAVWGTAKVLIHLPSHHNTSYNQPQYYF